MKLIAVSVKASAPHPQLARRRRLHHQPMVYASAARQLAAPGCRREVEETRHTIQLGVGSVSVGRGLMQHAYAE